MMDSVCLCVSPYIGDQCGSIDEKERKERYSNIAIGVNYVNYIVASFASWSKSIWNPKTGGTRIRGSEGYCLLSKVSIFMEPAPISPMAKPMRFPLGWLGMPGSPE